MTILHCVNEHMIFGAEYLDISETVRYRDLGPKDRQ